MPRPTHAHVLLRFAAPEVIWEVTARLDFYPREGVWDVLLDGHPIGAVTRTDRRWHVVGSLRRYGARLGAATELIGAESYLRLPEWRVPHVQRGIMRRLGAQEYWDVHQIRAALGIATQP